MFPGVNLRSGPRSDPQDELRMLTKPRRPWHVSRDLLNLHAVEVAHTGHVMRLISDRRHDRLSDPYRLPRGGVHVHHNPRHTIDIPFGRSLRVRVHAWQVLGLETVGEDVERLHDLPVVLEALAQRVDSSTRIRPNQPAHSLAFSIPRCNERNL